MKIGCVIAYRKGHTNYGTSLVGYALIYKLRQLGYEVEVINYIKRLNPLQKIAWAINAVRCGMGKSLLNRFVGRKNLKNMPSYAVNIAIRTAAVEAYKDQKLIPFFCNYVGYTDLCRGTQKYDAVVVGSDQVWLPMGLPTKFFNLIFVADDVRRIAYASSFGVSEIPDFQKKATGAYLDRFYRIGVREQRGKEIVDALSHREAKVVLDPTLLLDRKEWEKEIESSDISQEQPYIFCYFLGTNQDSRKAVLDLKEKTGYKIITVRHMDEYVADDEMFGDEAPYNMNPNDFVKYISQAAYVCTDSFHCSAFCIQFHKQFMTFYRFKASVQTGRNSRIDSLFNVLGVNREHIYNGDIDRIDLPIDWNVVDKRLEALRTESVNFLTNALEGKA